MEKAKAVALRLKALDVNAMMRHILSKKNVQDYIIRLNHEQLLAGYDAKGVPLSSYRPYSPMTVAIKGQTRVDLFDSGNFYDTFRVEVKEKGFEIVANTDLYGYDFKDVYGQDIIGLSEESMKKLEAYLLPEAKAYIKDFLLRT